MSMVEAASGRLGFTPVSMARPTSPIRRHERQADANVDVMSCAFIHFALIVEAQTE
jgi:hypothetical protein